MTSSPRVAQLVDAPLKSVMVATDFSGASEKPLRRALAIARHYKAKFYLAHVVSSLGYKLAGPGAASVAADAVGRETRQWEDELVRSGALAGLRHEVIVREAGEGGVWEELEKILTEVHVDMLVVGTHGRRGFGKLLLGSVAEQIFRHADGPVLTVGPGSSPDSPVETARALQPILFATDFEEGSLHALRYAISFANHFGTKLVLLHVLPAVPMLQGSHRPTADAVRDLQEHARADRLRRLEALASQHAKLAVPAEFLVEFGSPSETILQVANRFAVDAIVMGLCRTTRIGAASHLPWAAAYEVVCASSCPVLTVRN
jgi:nucleotide-binding universal stress UspA family protein